MRYIIFAPSYNANSGGSIVLHKFCHILNNLGHESYLHPIYLPKLIHKNDYIAPLYLVLKSFLQGNRFTYKTNPFFNTPVIRKLEREKYDQYVVIYPEIVNGNPLRINKVVRWFLHEPGHHTGQVFYSPGEIYYDFNSFSDGFKIPGSKLSDLRLYITHMPTEIYNLVDALPFQERSGTAYCIRKGSNKKIVHNLDNSILIDGKSHFEISKIFKSVKTFISYDCYTAYSALAVLCGADVIVVPDDGVSKTDWHPEDWQRYGVAYGFSDEEMILASSTKCLVLNEIKKREKDSYKLVDEFVNETNLYFR